MCGGHNVIGWHQRKLVGGSVDAKTFITLFWALGYSEEAGDFTYNICSQTNRSDERRVLNSSRLRRTNFHCPITPPDTP